MPLDVATGVAGVAAHVTEADVVVTFGLRAVGEAPVVKGDADGPGTALFNSIQEFILFKSGFTPPVAAVAEADECSLAL